MQCVNDRCRAPKEVFQNMAMALKASRKPIKLLMLAWAPSGSANTCLDSGRPGTKLFAEPGSLKESSRLAQVWRVPCPRLFNGGPGDINPISV